MPRARNKRFGLETERAPSTAIYPLDTEGSADLARRFEEYAQDALESLPADLLGRMSNIEIVVEDEPPQGRRLLGLYQGVPLTRRSSYYGGVLPDKIRSTAARSCVSTGRTRSVFALR